jgi:hypothetical protein
VFINHFTEKSPIRADPSTDTETPSVDGGSGGKPKLGPTQ